MTPVEARLLENYGGQVKGIVNTAYGEGIEPHHLPQPYRKLSEGIIKLGADCRQKLEEGFQSEAEKLDFFKNLGDQTKAFCDGIDRAEIAWKDLTVEQKRFVENISDHFRQNAEMDIGALSQAMKMGTKLRNVEQAANPEFAEQIRQFYDMMQATGSGYLGHTNSPEYTKMMNTAKVVTELAEKSPLNGVQRDALGVSFGRLSKDCRAYLAKAGIGKKSREVGEDRFAGALGILNLVDKKSAERVRAKAQAQRKTEVTFDGLQQRAQQKATQREPGADKIQINTAPVNNGGMLPKKNAEGKTYPWALEGKDFATYESVYKYTQFLAEMARTIGKTGDVTASGDILQGMEEENSLFANEVNQIVGGMGKGDKGHIKVASIHQGYSYYCTPEQKPKLTAEYDKLAGISKELGAHLKSAYAGKKDESSRHLQEKAEQFAEWLDLQAEAADPRAGNIVEAEFHAPYLYVLNMESGSAPKIESKEFKEIVRVLEHGDDGKSPAIYDDYMTIMSAGAKETKVQFHRQKMEAGGWNAEKEQTYLQELRAVHQKTVDAYDRLWQVDDRGQYDSVLNNKLDHMIGKDPSNTRDMNCAIGCMRGEMRAIDLGYDSRHLYVLGQIGMQEQILKKKSVEWEKRLETDAKLEKGYEEQLAKCTAGTKDFEKYEKSLKRYQESVKNLRSQIEAMKEYKKDLDLFKKSIWNKRVNSKEEMEAAEKQVDDFFAAHQEKKYDFLQSLRKGHATQFDYAKEEAKAQPVVRDTRQTQSDYEATVSETATLLTSWRIDVNAMTKDQEQVKKISKAGLAKDVKLPAEVDRGCKEVADDLLTTVNREISKLEKESSKYPYAMALQKAFLSASRNDLENYRAGIPMNKKSVYREAGCSSYFSTLVQLDPDCFQPDKLEATDKAVREYGLDKHAEAFLQLQERHQAFEMGKDYMQPAERRQAYQDLMADKRAMIKTVKELQQKTASPTSELITLFSGDEVRLNDFRGERGLQGLIDTYERDLARTDVPQAKGIDKAMEKFNSARASAFTNESPEHKQMREAGEKVQENIKKLQSGVTVDQETGKKRTMTEQEREGLLKETWGSMKTLEEKTDQYIAHATKNGTKLPHTPAGKARLAGALDLKKLNAQMKDHLGREKSLEAEAAPDKKMTERVNKLGKTGAEKLARMDREVDQFAKMSQEKYHDRTSESMAYGLDKCQYQAARVIAIAAVEELAMQGKVEARDITKEVMSNTKNIAGRLVFQKWVKEANMQELGKLSPKEMRANFVEYMSMHQEKDKDLEKGKDQEKGKDKDLEKGKNKDLEKGKDKDLEKDKDKDLEKGKDKEQGKSTDKKENAKTEKTKTETTKTEKTKTEKTKIPVPLERIAE